MRSYKIFFLAFIVALLPSIRISAQGNSFQDSLRQQLPKVNNTEDRIRILCQLAWNIGSSNPEETKKLGLAALKASESCADSALVADAMDAAALGYRWIGDLENAKKLYRRSLDIGMRNDITARIAWSSYHLASIALVEQEQQLAEHYASDGFKFFDKLGDTNMAIDALSLLAKTSSNYNDTLIQYLSNYTQTTSNENDKLFNYLRLANLYNLQENRKQAMLYVQLAMEIADKLQNSKGIIKAYYQIANYFRDYQKNYATALIYFEKILELQMQRNPMDAGDDYVNIGEMHQLMHHDSLALYYYNKGLETGKHIKHRHTMASSYQKLGDYHYEKGHYDDARHFYLKCYKTGCDVCPQIKFHQALLNIGNVYLLEDQPQNALDFYNKSIALAATAGDDRARIYSLQALGNMHKQNGDLTQSIDFYSQAYQIANNIGFLQGQFEITTRLSEIFHLQNRHDRAYEYLAIANRLEDTIRQMSEADNLAKLETYFDYQNLQMERQLDQAKSDEEISQQKLIRNFSIFGFILMLITGAVIYRSYRIKKSDNKLLHEQKRSVESLSKQVHEADQAKLQFYTNVSHELRTPLTLILGMTEKLKSLLHHDPNVAMIRKNSYKLLHLINHLLDLRKLDASKMKLSVQSSSINEFVKGIISSFEEHAKQKKISLNYHDDGVVSGYIDRDKIEKIIANLLSNAIKYTPQGGNVEVQVGKSGNGFLTMEIKDNGIGIPDQEVKEIFKRFYRVSESDHNGSGIGLALVKELVELHKGEISVNTLKGEGTSFTVSIPVDQHFYGENEIDEKTDQRASWAYSENLEEEWDINPEISNNSPDPDKKSILVVEDNTDLRKYIMEIFTDQYDVLEADNGMAGLKLACEYVPDIIVSDVLMPKMSGIQLVEKLKIINSTSHIPIILLTAKDDLGTRLSGFDKGADDYICKPFESAILKSRVENLLRIRKHLVEKFSKQFHLQPREITIEDAEQKFLQKTIDLIENHISDPNLNIDLLAVELGISRTQLYRKLKALTDYSANRFIRIIRLQRAAQILKQGQNNIAEVMDATGFSNYSYFNNCFKEYFDEYPKDYALLETKGSLN